MEHAGSVAGWIHQVAGQMRSISLPILVLALALHTCEMLLNALAWRNILRRAYPRSDVSYRVVLGGYGGGVALNSFLPAQAGTVAMLGIYRAQIQASTALGLVGAGVVQNAFYVVIGVAVCIALIATRQGALDPQFGSLYAHAVLVVVGAIVLGIVAWVVVRRCKALAGAREGVAILAEPRVYAAQVLAVELAAYVVRAAVTGALHARLRTARVAAERAACPGRQLDLLDARVHPWRRRNPAGAGVGRPAKRGSFERRRRILSRPAADPGRVGHHVRRACARVDHRLERHAHVRPPGSYRPLRLLTPGAPNSVYVPPVSQQPEPLLGLLDADAARTALICPDADVRLSHAELAELVDGLAGKLQAAGVGPGDRVAMVLPNGVELVAILFALASLGAAAAPLNPAYTEPRVPLLPRRPRRRSCC